MNSLTIKQLKALAAEKGIVPTGDKRKKQTWLDALTQAEVTISVPTKVKKTRTAKTKKQGTMTEDEYWEGYAKSLNQLIGVKLFFNEEHICLGAMSEEPTKKFNSEFDSYPVFEDIYTSQDVAGKTLQEIYADRAAIWSKKNPTLKAYDDSRLVA